MNEATYFTCLKMLSETMGKIPLKFYKQTERGKIRADPDRAARLLMERPNRIMTPATFWGTVEYNCEHFGNSYVWIQTNFEKKGKYGGEYKIISFWPMQSNCTDVLMDDVGVFGEVGKLYYRYSDPKTGKRSVGSSGCGRGRCKYGNRGCDRGRGCCRNNPERSSQKLYSWEKQASCEGGTDMHVKVNYPDAMMQIREIKCSVKAGDIIGEKLENHIQELDDNITVKESRKSGIERRERILNIQPSSSSDLETRKIAVIARWCISTMYTERILQKRLQSMLGDGYNLEVNIQQKTVSVTLQLKHYKNRKIIWEMLEGIVPLDQIIDVIIIYNTYRAYKPFTYKELKVKTYDQLRTEVIQ